MSPRRATAGLVLLVLLALLSLPTQAGAAPELGGGPFHAQGSVDQVAVTGAKPASTATLTSPAGRTVTRHRVDRLGSALFRDVAPGSGYRVQAGGDRAGSITVTSPTTPVPESTYTSQHLGDGFGYLRTRDGTLLSIDVRLPGPADAGPYPTVVEYSGYDPSNPDSRQPASSIASILGYATVGVNVRGTGCSGGAFDYFEELQALDGYDAVETIAAQPWVLGHRVGMVGISYPGITQLSVAALRPPHLAAITPSGVIDDTRATLYPGGILNDGFAVAWARDREDGAKPAAAKWAAARIEAGDATCRANQALRLQSADVHAEIRSARFAQPELEGRLAPASFLRDIDVPVLLAGSWQDEETGAHFADMVGAFSPAIPLHVILMNGVHADGLGPAVLPTWAEFLDFYVARRIPSIPPVTRVVADAALERIYGAGVTLPPDRFTTAPGYDAALAQFEAEPRVKVLFDVGAGDPSVPGAPVAGFSTTAATFPFPTATATPWYFGPGGALTTTPPTTTGSDRYDYAPGAIPRTDASKERPTFGAPTFDWRVLPAGVAVGYVTAPLARDTVVAGTGGSVDLWLRAGAPDVDLEVVVTEVRPDGEETYVQSGWLRASQRKLAPSSTAVRPEPTFLRRDAAPLPAGRDTLVRVPLYPFAHTFRAGSRLRVVVQPPGGNRPAWAFAALRPKGHVTVGVARSPVHASRVVLPVLDGIPVPTAEPACGALRGQPCRHYVAAANGG